MQVSESKILANPKRKRVIIRLLHTLLKEIRNRIILRVLSFFFFFFILPSWILNSSLPKIDRLSLFTVEEYQETDKKKKIKEKLT
jgi:cell division protein FtsB